MNMDILGKAAKISRKRETFAGKPLKDYKKAELLDTGQIFEEDKC